MARTFYGNSKDRKTSRYENPFSGIPFDATFCDISSSHILEDKGFQTAILYFNLDDKNTRPIHKLILHCVIHLLKKNIFSKNPLIVNDWLNTYETSELKQVIEKLPEPIQERELIIFLCILVNSENLQEAYECYYQVEKRCAIRDYWQILGYENSYEESELYTQEKSLSYIIGKCVIIPSIEFDIDEFALDDYGFDPKDGIWKRLPYNKLNSQKGDIFRNYNKKTTQFIIAKPDTTNDVFYKLAESLYDLEKYFTKDSKKTLFTANLCRQIFFATVPARVTILIFNIIHNIKLNLSSDPEIKKQSIIPHNPILTEYFAQIMSNSSETKKLNELIYFHEFNVNMLISPYIKYKDT